MRPDDRGDRLLMVGVGASAGGLEAFQELLRHLPADTGMSFVLVQHLDPKHESALTHLLARATTMPVCEVTQDLRVEPNNIYIIPPNVQMAIVDGVLKLTPRGTVRGAARSIDCFFESLAQDQREHAIGVVLSGTATDGTLGLEAIKAEGGVTFAQDESAKYDSMPRSAIAAGVVDFVLAPEQIAAELARIATHPFVVNAPCEAAPERHEEAEREADHRKTKGAARIGSRRAKAEAAAKEDRPDAGEDDFKNILLLLGTHCGVDFSRYKSNTIQRRITRRLLLTKHETLVSYAAFLKGNGKELDALYSDLLIGVTSFFRNPEAFDTLKRKVFPKILAQRGRDEPVRVWVLGCSTGQEAYSLAMTFAEATADGAHRAKLQIFATDLNEALLDKARHGLYAPSLAQDVSPERLRRFFVEEEGGYRVSKLLREQVVFARQNVMSDPPFSRMDLIACRNVLIYLEPELQQKIFPAFHYALKPGGFLFLGASESIGTFTDLFAPVDKKQKIFSRKAAPAKIFRLPLPSAPRSAGFARPAHPVAGGRPGWPEGLRGEFDAQREADRISVSQFAPPGVLIDAGGQVLQFRGATGAYLEPPTGKVSFDVLRMAREGLMPPLRAALKKATRDCKPVRREGVRLGTRAIALHVIPLRNVKEPCYLVLFEESAVSDGSHPSHQSPGTDAPQATHGASRTRTAELERELAETRECLQSIQEQNETATEELQASSEEVQSANEELQSMNEELETSKEELESTNEELTTINDEMLSRNSELNRLNADQNNVQISMQTAILLLARDLTIRRFTPPAERMFNLLATDVGRGIGGIRHNLEMPNLERLLAEVLDTVSLREREVQDKDGRWYALRARPYLTLDNKIDGVVLVLSDIDELKRSEQEIKLARDYAEATLRTAPIPLLVLRADLRVNTANDAFYNNFQVTPAMTEDRLIYEIGNGQWNIPALIEVLQDILPNAKVLTQFEITHEFDTIGRRVMLLNARRMENETGQPLLIVLAIEDVTERRQSESKMRVSQENYRLLVEGATGFAIIRLDFGGRVTMWNIGAARILGYDEAEILGEHFSRFFTPEDLAAGKPERELAQARAKEKGDDDNWLVRKDGTRFWASGATTALRDEAGELIGYAKIVRDMTERRQADEALRKSDGQFHTLADNMPQLAWIADAGTDGQIHWFNRGWYDYTGTTPEEMKGSGWKSVHHPEYVERVVQKFEHHVTHCLDWEDTFPLRGKDGQYCWFLSRMKVIRDESGAAVRMFGTNTDITERLQAQEQLLQLTGTLEARVMERTQELATSYDRLRTLAIDLTVAEQTERRRLATELHDYLAQQLVVTRMKVSQALRQDCEPEVRKILKDADQLLHQSLDYTRSLVSELTPQALYERGLGAGLQWLADQMRRQQILNVEISIDAPVLPLPESDAVLLFHSVRELLFNALKHSQTDRAFVSMRHDQHVLSITVSDHGCGFEVSGLKHDRSDRFGLLSIRERMLALGGGFDLQSEVGKGTVASLYLPLTVPDNRVETPVVGRDGSPPVQEALEAANQRTPTVQAPLIYGEPHSVTLIRVLIVDDHHMVREGLCSILREHDDIAIVGEASTGEQALQLVGTLTPDVVIMDMNMPGWNGAESTRRILSAYPATVVIGLSIQTDPHVAESMLEAGVAAFLPKEASGEALYTTIETAVGRS
ncbi:MAG: chemotaxis protein CheB [Nitrospirota bacterium]